MDRNRGGGGSLDARASAPRRERDPLGAYSDFIRHLRGLQESSVNEYVRDLRLFAGWLASQPGSRRRATLLTCSRAQVERYLASLSARGHKAVSVNRKIHSLRSFYGWALHSQLLEHSPMLGVRTLRTPQRIPRFLTFEDIDRLLEFTGASQNTGTVRGRQVHAMISVLYYLGLRRLELVDFRFEHVEQLSEDEIYLNVFGKGDKQRVIPFLRPAYQAYRSYLEVRPASRHPHVFISLKTGRPLSKYDVNSVCDQLSRKVELSRKLTPHLLRHTFATHLHLRGQPIEHINALLGHESLDTTRIYVHLDRGRLRASMETLCRCPEPGKTPTSEPGNRADPEI